MALASVISRFLFLLVESGPLPAAPGLFHGAVAAIRGGSRPKGRFAC